MAGSVLLSVLRDANGWFAAFHCPHSPLIISLHHKHRYSVVYSNHSW